MKITISCPSLQWTMGHPNGDEIGKAFSAVGFKFAVRDVPGGQLVHIKNSPVIELNTMEDLVELQKKLGYPLRIEDGYIEVVS